MQTTLRPHHPTSYRTLLYALILRKAVDHPRDDNNICVHHKSGLFGLSGAAKIIKDTTSTLTSTCGHKFTHFSFSAGHFKSTRTLSKIENYWESLWAPSCTSLLSNFPLQSLLDPSHHDGDRFHMTAPRIYLSSHPLAPSRMSSRLQALADRDRNSRRGTPTLA